MDEGFRLVVRKVLRDVREGFLDGLAGGREQLFGMTSCRFRCGVLHSQLRERLLPGRDGHVVAGGAPDPDAALSAEREAARNRMKTGGEAKILRRMVERLMKLNLDQKREVISRSRWRRCATQKAWGACS